MYLKDCGIGMLLNPRKTPGQVEAEAADSHELYLISHHDLQDGERLNRGYRHPYAEDRCYGKIKHDRTLDFSEFGVFILVNNKLLLVQ